MWNAGELAHALRDAAGYGFDISLWHHDWPLLKQLRDEFIARCVLEAGKSLPDSVADWLARTLPLGTPVQMS